MAKKVKLTVDKRNVLGKKVKKLRRDGILPANIYGKDIKSIAVQVKEKEFETVFKEAGETGLIELELDKKIHPVLIHNVQLDHLSQKPLHADFYQVNLAEKVKTMVPVISVGIPKAVAEKVGLLLQPLSEIEIEALPQDLPERIEINVEGLDSVDEQITVGELKIPSGVTVLTDAGQVAVKITELVSKEAQEQAAAEAAAAETAKAESEGAKAESDSAKAEEAPTEEATAGGAKGETKPSAETKPEAEPKPSTPLETKSS